MFKFVVYCTKKEFSKLSSFIVVNFFRMNGRIFHLHFFFHMLDRILQELVYMFVVLLVVPFLVVLLVVLLLPLLLLYGGSRLFVLFFHFDLPFCISHSSHRKKGVIWGNFRFSSHFLSVKPEIGDSCQLCRLSPFSSQKRPKTVLFRSAVAVRGDRKAAKHECEPAFL